jgi:hypothetical protein
MDFFERCLIEVDREVLYRGECVVISGMFGSPSISVGGGNWHATLTPTKENGIYDLRVDLAIGSTIMGRPIELGNVKEFGGVLERCFENRRARVCY